MPFLDPAAKGFWTAWEQEAYRVVAHLRAVVGADHEEPSLLELVGELSEESEDFQQMWARHDVRTGAATPFPFATPLSAT
ncbi:hypothetical protein Psi02_79320 [Planotetraspora silvatica]|uniref:MmyB-like transcription regulator ligand binding domain-containing protein n=1 Tax=Planotetraspora silvatica TaxID=234614 RepID=A0A8J3USZ6_9ACTN|nr:hypothetical protein Psi02_79320 [Planotetraspora silvatica]